MPQRFAIYYAPATTDQLWDRASLWLGRDSESGELLDGAVAGIDRSRLLNLTQSAGRYGFHATIKPPMALVDGASEDDLRQQLQRFAETMTPVPLGRLQLADIDGFLALITSSPNEALQDFAANVVETFEPFRAPLHPRDHAARLARGLTPRQEELLNAYGYPYVFDEFQFHMTLTDRLAEEDRDDLRTAAQTWFAPVLDTEITLDRLVLFVEPETGLAFRRVADFVLKG
jgi:putative phosphonate metabolism protein